MKNTSLFFKPVLLLVLFTLGFCFQSLWAAEPVKIGLITTLTTPAGYLGKDARDGFLLAVKDGKLNGVSVEVIVEDDQFKPATGKAIADKMLKRDKVLLLTGIIFSNVAGAVVPTVTKAGAFYLSSNAAPSGFAGKKCNKNYYVISWQNDSLHEAAGALSNNMKYKKAAMIAPNYPAGIDSIRGFRRVFRGEKIDPIYTQLGQTDYAVEISKIKNSGADHLFVFLPGGMGINFLKQYAQSGLNKKIPVVTSFVNADAVILNAVGDSMLGVRSASQWTQTQNKSSEAFTADFENKYGRTPTVYASQAYETAWVMGQALAATNGKISKNSKAFRKALNSIKSLPLRGKFSFGKNNHPIQNWYSRIVEKNKDRRIYNKVQGMILSDHTDVYAVNCKL